MSQVTTTPPAGPSGRPGRYTRSFSGLVGAMIVLLLVIAAFVGFRDLNRTDPVDPVEAVDWQPAVAYARSQAEFDVLAPSALPEGWMATSVRFRGGREPSWHLGMLTGEGRYVGLEQADRTAGSMVEDFVDEDAVRGDDVALRGQPWQSWSDEGGDVALVREADDVTTLLVGTVGLDELEEFAVSLR